ncbi:MAG TPA: ATP-binding protein [Dissulfurispiraceae bacterium]|nr:ATP-binding protein [Dissulfurispiraceae bacterium]
MFNWLKRKSAFLSKDPSPAGTDEKAEGDLSGDRYKSLKIRLFFLIAALAAVPIITIIIFGTIWLQGALREDFNNQLKGNIENTRQSIDFFIEERISALRFLASSNSFGQLSDGKYLNDVFIKFKREFGELVDLGVIDSNGVQVTYSGPYDLKGKNYSNQDWFNAVAVRGVYVSDVFMGYRKFPHFVIAVKKELPDRDTFCILRATIDMATLNRYISTVNLKSKDDAFIINRIGILQTQSRYHGNVLEPVNFEVPRQKEAVTLTEIRRAGTTFIFGFAGIRNSDWTIGVMVAPTAQTSLINLLAGDIAAIYLIIILISLGIFSYIKITIKVVNWIREAELEREEAIVQTHHTGRLASIGRLAAGVAHEINNPLAIINEKAGLMKDLMLMSDMPVDRDKFISLIKAISDSVHRCRTITHRLLGFARRMDIQHEEIDLNDTIKEVIEFLDKEVLYRNIGLETKLKEDLPRIVSDKGQLQQVFLNIVNNAIDAVKDGGKIIISSDVKTRNMVRISIKDNGRGIPKDAIKSIFEPFYTTKDKGKGTGLGLSISYGIVQRLGGDISVESEEGKGTIFYVDLPIKAAGR